MEAKVLTTYSLVDVYRKAACYADVSFDKAIKFDDWWGLYPNAHGDRWGLRWEVYVPMLGVDRRIDSLSTRGTTQSRVESS